MRSFRDGLKVGDLVDFHSRNHGEWFVGEVIHIIKHWAGLHQDGVMVQNAQFGEMETVRRDSSRLCPPVTRSAPQPTAAADAALPSSRSGSAVAFSTVCGDGQVPANRVPLAVLNFGYQLRKGDTCDCMDQKKWIFSEVIGMDATRLLIHYGQ